MLRRVTEGEAIDESVNLLKAGNERIKYFLYAVFHN